jgi:hypothetical protein
MQGKGDDQLSTDAGQPLVTLEVYSGQENPSWPLEGNALAEVTARARDLGSGEAAPPPAPVLGYRGFRIEHLGPDLPDTLLVGRGVVTVVRGKEAEHRNDSAGLETVLLADAAQRGYADLLRAAGAPSPRETA